MSRALGPIWLMFAADPRGRTLLRLAGVANTAMAVGFAARGLELRRRAEQLAPGQPPP